MQRIGLLRSSWATRQAWSERLTRRDIELFAIMSGDVNSTHLDKMFVRSDMFHKVVAHGIWGGALLISIVLGTQLPRTDHRRFLLGVGRISPQPCCGCVGRDAW